MSFKTVEEKWLVSVFIGTFKLKSDIKVRMPGTEVVYMFSFSDVVFIHTVYLSAVLEAVNNLEIVIKHIPWTWVLHTVTCAEITWPKFKSLSALSE